MLKLDRTATTKPYVSTPDDARLTFPNSDWSQWATVAATGSRAGADSQYIFSNGALGSGAINLVMFGASDSTVANRAKVGIYLTSSLAFVSANTLPADQAYLYVPVRSGSTLTLYRCPVLSVAPTDASAVTIEGSVAISAAFDGPSGLLAGARGDLNSTRFSEQAHGRMGRVNRALTPFEIAKLAYGMRAADLGYTPVFEVGMKDLSDVVDTGPNALPFTVYGTPTAVAEPAYGFNGDIPVPTDSITVTVDVERVTQRSGSTGVVYPTCGYTNTTPASIERQLYALDGTTVTHAWSAIPGAMFSNGNVSFEQGVSIPAGLKRRIAVRTKNASGAVLATSSVSAAFGVGGLDGIIGSSSAEKMFDSTSGTGVTANASASKFNENGWALMGSVGAGILWANSMISQSGMCRGLLDYGIGGTTLAQWLDLNGDPWKAFAAGVAAAGGKLESVYITVGSNDAATAGLITSRAQHAANLRLLIQRVRDLTGQPELPVLLSGFNRRGRFLAGQTAAAFAIAADQIRMAENDVGNDPFVTHVQTLQFELRTDDLVHLTPNAAGFPACVTLSATVFGRRLYGDGAYLRGPRLGNATFVGSTITVPIAYRAGSDIAPASGITGITGADGSGALTLTAARQSAGMLSISANRAIVAPLELKVFAGGSPDISGAVFDNGTPAMILAVDTEMVAVDGNTAPAPDTTAPVMNGAITVVSVSTAGATLSLPAATDNVGVAGYEYSINGGLSYVNMGTSPTASLTGLQPATGYTVLVRAYDAAGNRATALSRSFTTSAAPPWQGDVDASKIAAARKVVLPGGTRVVAFGSAPSTALPGGPFYQDGKWTIAKHALDEFYCVGDIGIDLTESDTGALTVEAIVQGVTLLEQPVVQGHLIPVRLGDLDVADGALNFCTLRVTCENGEQFDRTIWFVKNQDTWSLNKDPDDKRYYVADWQNILADSNTQVQTALPAEPVGVGALVQPVMQGDLMVVKLGGMDTAPNAANACTLGVLCANGERFFRTIQFNKVEH